MGRERFARLMRALGYRPRARSGGVRVGRPSLDARRADAPDAPSDSPFAVLKQMKGR